MIHFSSIPKAASSKWATPHLLNLSLRCYQFVQGLETADCPLSTADHCYKAASRVIKTSNSEQNFCISILRGCRKHVKMSVLSTTVHKDRTNNSKHLYIFILVLRKTVHCLCANLQIDAGEQKCTRFHITHTLHFGVTQFVRHCNLHFRKLFNTKHKNLSPWCYNHTPSNLSE